MTNLIGSLLVLLSVETTPITVTNIVDITCKEAGCTNQVDENTLVVDKLGKKCAWHRHNASWLAWPYAFPCDCVPDTLKTNVVKGCDYWHTSNVVTRIGTRERLVFGNAGTWRLNLETRKSNAVPLFSVITQTITNAPRDSIYPAGTWIQREAR